MSGIVDRSAFDEYEGGHVGNLAPGLSPEQKAAMMAAADMIKIIAEMVVGYRKTLIDGGVSAEVADRMAMEFHTKVLTSMS